MSEYELSQSTIDEYAHSAVYLTAEIKNELISSIEGFTPRKWFGNTPRMDSYSTIEVENLNAIMDMIDILIPNIQEKIKNIQMFDRENDGFSVEFINVVSENIDLLSGDDYEKFVRRFFKEIHSERLWDEYNGQYHIRDVIDMACVISKNELRKIKLDVC